MLNKRKKQNFALIKILVPLMLVFFIFTASSCTTYTTAKQVATEYRDLSTSIDSLENSNIIYNIVPATHNFTQTQYPSGISEKKILLHCAKGESESSQIVFLNTNKVNKKNIEQTKIELKNETLFLINENQNLSIVGEIGIIGYVPVTKPSIAGYHKKANFPDPVIPDNTFLIEPSKSQACLFTVYIPRDTQPGEYTGNIEVLINGESEFLIPISVFVYDVTLPVTPFLNTRFNKPNSFHEPYYYDGIWSKDDINNQYLYYMERFRINTGFKADWSTVFSTDSNGIITPNWITFDKEVEEKMSVGIATFDIYIDVSYDILENEQLKQRYEQEFILINTHLKEKGWTENFIWYNFDEPKDNKIKTFNEISAWMKTAAPDIPVLTTLGWASTAYRKMAGNLDIWVPHINQYETNFFPSQQSKGDKVWIYTCIQNCWRNFPDSWKIDTYGTSQRSLGWWLYKYNIDGYLYWAMSRWSRNNPWENAETFIFCNGDGSLVYPPFDKTSAPYASLRLHRQRDGFEDYDFLTMLERQLNDSPEKFSTDEITEIKEILSGNSVIAKRNKYTKDDYIMPILHKRILELLSK